ncbi:unnamed protein product [Urochloa humidicola]
MLAGHIVIIFIEIRKGIPLVARALWRRPTAASTWHMLSSGLYGLIIVLPVNSFGYIIAYLYGYSGPFVCIALALWRIAQHDYSGGDAGSGGPGSNLVPALDMFYSLVLLQGGLYVLWALWEWGLFDDDPASLLDAYRQRIGLPDEGWCRDYLARYLADTRARCWREPTSIRGRTLCHFALESLDSGSWEEMHSGVRWLDAMSSWYGEDMRPHLLPLRVRIQKLIDALGWRQPADGTTEMRVAAARIIKRLAPDIHLAHFPGAMDCISSLLDWESTDLLLTSKKTCPDKLILQGMAILEGLSLDHGNCTVICSTPGLLHKIMAPLSSAHLMSDVSNNTYWAFLLSRSLKVLYNLIQAPGNASSSLRWEICSSKQSMSNLGSIVEAAGLQELQMGAMEILTELALDNLAKETKVNLIKKQLQIFLANVPHSLLLTKIESNSPLIMTVQDNVIVRLIRILDAKNTTTDRTIAAQIFENLCAHCDFNKQWVKETLLPMVLKEILSGKRVTPENGVSSTRNSEENHNILSTQQGDIEIQETSTADQNKSSDGGNEDQTTTSKLMREAFLSLALVIRDKLITADDFDDAVQKEGLGPAAFVAKIKTIIEENCQETAESLRIVKLCGRIVEPMMQRDQYAQHFRNTDFVSSLSNASKIMSKLESCMLFAATDFRSQKTMRPLLSDIKKRALRLVR